MERLGFPVATEQVRNPVPFAEVDTDLLFLEGSTLYKEGMLDKAVRSDSSMTVRVSTV